MGLPLPSGPLPAPAPLSCKLVRPASGHGAAVTVSLCAMLTPSGSPRVLLKTHIGWRASTRSASEYAVDLGCHDEVVLMQSLDLLGLQRDRRIAPTEVDIRMMAFSFREFPNLLNKSKRLPEIAKSELRSMR